MLHFGISLELHSISLFQHWFNSDKVRSNFVIFCKICNAFPSAWFYFLFQSLLFVKNYFLGKKNNFLCASKKKDAIYLLNNFFFFLIHLVI